MMPLRESLDSTLEESRRMLQRIRVQLFETDRQLLASRALIDRSFRLLRAASRVEAVTREKNQAPSATI